MCSSPPSSLSFRFGLPGSAARHERLRWARWRPARSGTSATRGPIASGCPSRRRDGSSSMRRCWPAAVARSTSPAATGATPCTSPSSATWSTRSTSRTWRSARCAAPSRQRGLAMTIAPRVVDLEREPLPAGPYDVIVTLNFLQRDLFGPLQDGARARRPAALRDARPGARRRARQRLQPGLPRRARRAAGARSIASRSSRTTRASCSARARRAAWRASSRAGRAGRRG